MLNILQTGDLHLGKVLYEYSLIEDQRHVLNLLLLELKSFAYDALIISGDIYDRAVPSPEAVSLFDDFLTHINKEFPTLPICIISGNHDSQTRLSFASTFLKSKNIYITTNPEDCDTPIIITSKNNDHFALYQVPFLHPGSLKSNAGELLKNQSELVEQAIQRIQTAHKKLQKDREDNTLPALLNCHLFTLKGATSDSERLFLGNAELIDPKLFSSFLYTAIGHLHKKQKVTNKAYYSGSPLAYSFSETNTEKGFLRIELNSKDIADITVTTIPIIPLRKLVQVESSFEDFEKMTNLKDDFIEFTCTNSIPIENIAPKLRKNFRYLLSIKQKAITSAYQNTEESLANRKSLFEKKDSFPVKEILGSFLKSVDLMAEEDTCEANTEWKDAIELFESIAKQVEAHQHEAN